MDCADEAALVRRALEHPGITAIAFDLVGRRVDITYDDALIGPAAIAAALARTGLAAHTHEHGEHVHDDHVPARTRHETAWWWAMASGALLVAAWIWDVWQSGTWLTLLIDETAVDTAPSSLLAIAAIGAGLWPFVPRAAAALRHLRLDMHVLVCLSAVGAAVVGQPGEGAAVAFLFAAAHLMEAWSIRRAREALSELVGHEPGWGVEGRHQAAAAERWIERFAAVYTPVVTFAAVAVAALPPLVDGQWQQWFYRALIFLVLACPCALVISTPVTVVAALTSAARRGVLFRGGLALERAADDTAAALASGDLVVTARAGGGVAFAARHARRAVSVIQQNAVIALATKAAFLASALFGAAPLWLAVLADTGATVIVTLNGLRLLRVPPVGASR
jgi:cation transport ATPase